MTLIHIEFQRVQTWLFDVPRLRAMVGANTILGETLRDALFRLATAPSKTWSLQPVESPGSYPGADPDDPITDPEDEIVDRDDPRADAELGILSRDGGHFEAQVAGDADDFAREAAALIRRRAPGLRFRISVGDRTDSFVDATTHRDLPVLARCSWSRGKPASVRVRQGSEHAWVALEVDLRHRAARDSEEMRAKDLASRLIAKTQLPKTGSRPKTFEALAAGGYLAVIHADGNNVGAGISGESHAGRAAFFHRNRVLLRRAVRYAINRSVERGTSSHAESDTFPLVPLMLGGDDLLVVSRAAVALEFVTDLCSELERLQDDSADFHLTLGVGVVIARETIPFHRLHEVAEQLAASAKRQYRGLPDGQGCSVVDWAVYSGSWLQDPTELRRRDWIRRSGTTRLLLSGRPLPVLGAEDSLASLQGLLAAATHLRPVATRAENGESEQPVPEQRTTDLKAARSQLRALVDQLPLGRHLAELAFAELPAGTKRALTKAGVTTVWNAQTPGYLLTSLLDLVEIVEIPLLGATRKVANDDVWEEGLV